MSNIKFTAKEKDIFQNLIDDSIDNCMDGVENRWSAKQLCLLRAKIMAAME